MPIWNCLITGTQPDGSYTWRRIDAAQPRGVLPLDKTPEGANIGVEVTKALLKLQHSGRTVGVITHVETMQRQLPIGIRVVKSDAGSGLEFPLLQ